MSKQENTKRSWFARHKIATALLVFLAIMVVAGAAGGGSDTTATDKKTASAGESSEASKQTASTAKLGEKVRDGKFEFVVNSVKCGETTVGQSEYLQKKAQGQFCRLNLTVSNIGNEAQSLFADNQKLLDAQGREYSYASEATIYAAPSGAATWYSEINPGNTVSGDFLYDIPAGVTPTIAELHDSSFSGGVKVTLQ